jgi:hypothetical protein
MSPVLQALIRVAIRVLFGLFLLRKMALVIRGDFPHMRDIFLVIFGRILLWVLLENLNDLSPTI